MRVSRSSALPALLVAAIVDFVAVAIAAIALLVGISDRYPLPAVRLIVVLFALLTAIPILFLYRDASRDEDRDDAPGAGRS
jgi:membrane protein YdbS with pleckstrin-like domain